MGDSLSTLAWVKPILTPAYAGKWTVDQQRPNISTARTPVDDVSAAGENLFHAIMKLQRKRSSLLTEVLRQWNAHSAHWESLSSDRNKRMETIAKEKYDPLRGSSCELSYNFPAQGLTCSMLLSSCNYCERLASVARAL
jgi:hypothetical protein